MLLERLGSEFSEGYDFFNINLVKGMIYVEICPANGNTLNTLTADTYLKI